MCCSAASLPTPNTLHLGCSYHLHSNLLENKTGHYVKFHCVHMHVQSLPHVVVRWCYTHQLEYKSKIIFTVISVAYDLFFFLQISFASAVSTLSNRTRFRNYFRTYPNFENFVPVLLSVLNHYSWNRIVFLTQDENVFSKVILLGYIAIGLRVSKSNKFFITRPQS